MFTTKSIIRFFILGFVILMISGAASASPQLAPNGTGFTYQGKLTDGGVPTNGTYDLQFTLFDALTGGSQVGSTVAQRSVNVSNGLFTVQLDFGNVFNGTALYLEIGVRLSSIGGAYTTLTPRQPLSPTPYALYSTQAGNAAQLNTQPASYYLNASNINSGTLGTNYFSAYADLGAEGYLGNVAGDLALNNGILQATLNSDLLDGLHAASFALASHTHWGQTWTGSGTGLTLNGGTYGLLSNGSTYGVSGTSTNGTGINGNSTNGTGVYGSGGNYGVYGSTYSGAGVSGNSTDGDGVDGTSTNGYGVSGTSTGTGVRGYGATGVWGASNTPGGIGVYGAGGTSGTGVAGGSTSGTGVYGGSSTSYGIYGTGYPGVFGVSNTPEGIGVYGKAWGGNGSNYAGYFLGNVYVTGNLTVSGSKSAVVNTQDYGTRTLYAVESPENWFQDFGTGQLMDGKAVITIDPVFAETVNLADDYHVFFTPMGDCALYVSDKTPTSFTVRAMGGQTCSIAFDYNIVAKRLGYETVRLAVFDPSPATGTPNK